MDELEQQAFRVRRIKRGIPDEYEYVGPEKFISAVNSYGLFADIVSGRILLEYELPPMFDEDEVLESDLSEPSYTVLEVISLASPTELLNMIDMPIR